MRIGIMLRALDEKGGIGVYTRNITEELLAIDERNEYVLFYSNPENLGRYADPPRVRERLVRAPHKSVWDQLAVPYACWREKVDVLFHPKFTVPLLAPCRSVMVVHGADWFIPEYARFYKPLDVAYIRAVMPFYFRKATRVVSVSELTTQDFNRVLGLPPGKVTTIYFGPAKHFRRVEDESVLREVRQKYGLPERFILTLSKIGGGGRKNIEGVFQAFARLYGRVPHKLVVGGKDCSRFRDDYRIPASGYGADVVFPGWIDQADLPAVYSLADLYLYPSNLEAFPIPLTEAMACGTPIITSRVNGLEEIAGDAALLVDPEDPTEIADAALRVLTDPRVAAGLAAAGLKRSRIFNWSLCGERTLSLLEEVAAPVAAPSGNGRAAVT